MLETLPGASPFPEPLALRLADAVRARGPEYRPRTHHLVDGRPRFTNRLVLERSPYLLQHAHNPVSWWPWGDEAFEEARRTGRPVFLSVGYSTCHWCHVMERESFEDEEIARVLNERFVPIKVDREERPGRRRRLHDRGAAAHGRRRLAHERLAHAGPRAVLRRDLLPAARRRPRRAARVSLDPARDRRPVRAGPGARARRHRLARRGGPHRARRARRSRGGPARPGPDRGGGLVLPAELRPGARRGAPGPQVPLEPARCGSSSATTAARATRSRSGWRRSRSRRWRRAGSTISSAAGSTATRPTRSGSSRTSRRCSTTTRSSRSPTRRRGR